ncbi:MAG: SDR family oxidoreductase [Acidobacteria bacterium]|nr:SDR family oxidoreductase [Acidobacteriota bacterium]
MKPLILLTGATGYIGGRLLKRLEAENQRVRCIVRRPEFLRSRAGPETEIVRGDLLNAESLEQAMTGIHTAYYLVHSMGMAEGFEETDRRAAESFAAAARTEGIQKIIYLGGLGSGVSQLSPHLRSRQEVGEILRRSGIHVIEFRASIILGSGSLSFEMIRALVERLPVMITPRWVNALAQPISIEDVLQYLRCALDLPVTTSQIFEIGGPDRMSYGDLMREYARQRRLRRLMISVPVLTPRLSSLWLGLVTPLYARVGRKLINSIRHATVVQDDAAMHAFPVRPIGVRDAIAIAMRNEDREYSETRWSDSVSSAGPIPRWGGVRFGNRLVDSRTLHVPVPPQAAFMPIQRIGGSTGWYYGNWLWSLRGWVDLFMGGVGMRRGRRDRIHLKVGDSLDFWRVEAFEPERRLLLAAEMKLPGRAWLEFEVTGDAKGSIIRQTAIFDPIGLRGLIYWYSVYPLHQFVFSGMLRGIAHAAQSLCPRRGTDHCR